MAFSLILFIIFLSFSTVIFFLLSGIVSNYRQYRRHLQNHLEALLRDNFITDSVGRLFLLAVSLSILLTMAGWLSFGGSGWRALVGAALGFVISLRIPFIVIERMRQRHISRFVEQLPDGLHALSAALRSGANMSHGLQQLAEWQPAPLSQEMGLVVAQRQCGVDPGETLDNLHKRIPVQEVELMNTAIKMSSSVGGNVSDTLETLALTLSEKAGVEGKVKALTSTGRMQGLVAMAIPVAVGGFIIKMQPDKAQFFFHDPRGWLTLGIVATLMFLAHFSIQRIVNVDV